MHFVRPPRFPAGVNPSGNNNIGGYVMDPTHRGRGEEAWTKDISLASRESRKDYLDSDKIEMSGDLNSYVQLSRDKSSRTDHDYSYPIMDSYKTGNRDTLGSLKKHHHFDSFSCQPAPRLPVKAKKKKDWRKDGRKNLTMARAQCRHCLEMYSEEDNHRGSCEYAPDRVLTCIRATSCIKSAQCMLYHCMSDSEGDFQHPCSCDASDGHCRKRWTALALLSIFVPCLWCYLPCRACHRCGVRCGVCGGRHDPA